jgi:hypothetical protein
MRMTVHFVDHVQELAKEAAINPWPRGVRHGLRSRTWDSALAAQIRRSSEPIPAALPLC